MQKLLSLIIILLAGSITLPAQQGYTYVVDEDFVHYENIFKAVEGLVLTESNQIVVSAQWHPMSGHQRIVRLNSNGTHDPSFGTPSSTGGGGGYCIVYQMVI